MAFLKQILVTLIVLLAGVALWMKLDERPARLALESAPGMPAILRSAILTLSPGADRPPEPMVGATPLGGGGPRNARPTIVVAGAVGTAETRNRVQVIGTGEAERSVTVYPDISGIIREVRLSSGEEVAVGQTLAVLEKAAEEVAVERARVALDAATAKLDRYRRLEQSRAVTSVEATDVAREVQLAQLDLKAAEVALGKRTLTAPIAGRIGIVNVDTGDLVTTQSVVTTIDDRRRLRVIFYAPEAVVPELRVGAAVEAVSTARPEMVHRGAISAIDSRLDEASRTLRTEALLDNTRDELRPGMSFAVSLALPGETLMAVDPLAVQWERDGAFVWKIVGDSVEKAPVRIVERSIDSLLFASDAIAQGDHVVVEGVQSVREGGRITIQNRDSVAPPAPPATDAPAPTAQETGPERRAEAPRAPVPVR